MSRMTLPVLLAAALTVAGLASPAGAAVAPGRVWLDTGQRLPAPNVDAAGASAVVGLPDGGAVLMASERGRGVVAAQIRRDGSLDPAFGTRGVARVAVPTLPASEPRQIALPFGLLDVLRRPDGRLLLVGSGTARSRYELPRLVLVQLLADGSLDKAFGQGGIAVPGVQASCGGRCRLAALAPGGGIVVGGNTGSVDPSIEHDPNAPASFQWVVARLAPSGAPDASFGNGGLVPIPGALGRNAGATATALLPDGRIVAYGRGPVVPWLTRLLPDGTPDPSFHGGSPVLPPMRFGFEMLLHPETDAVDLLGDRRLLRYGADGEQDAAIDLPTAGSQTRLLAEPGGGVLVWSGVSYGPRPLAEGDLVLQRVAPDDRVDAPAGRRLGLGFGGGLATVFARLAPRPVGSLAQTGFTPADVVRRPDGSLLVAGGIRIVRYTGEGAGFSSGLFAAASLTPALAPDPSFGGAAVRPRVRVAVAAQHLAGVRRLKRVLVRAETTSPGLAVLRVRAGGRTVAEMLEPLFTSGHSALRVRLTRAGERYLRARKGSLRVTVSVRARDVLGQEAVASAGGRLLR